MNSCSLERRETVLKNCARVNIPFHEAVAEEQGTDEQFREEGGTVLKLCRYISTCLSIVVVLEVVVSIVPLF